ncbi:predicted protein [Nematostella vectensis]|uniref:Uncharacterized protein n=1 Tax=Nematostella vectensis TaxID=45351 RepID=A7SA34_NEMVE|nr:predicted protein [Nematostella vectensis]|eukprot:XP_001631453.1 predicted protein [Nematostella vectensis]
MTMHRKSMEELDLLKSNSAATSANLESESSGQSNESTVKNVLSALIEENLSKLFECLQVEYGKHILVSPKWKNFGSQKLAFSEKTRLNNAIWRCWHLQFKKGKKPLFCQFVSPLSEEREPPKNTHLAVILEGRYWRRKLDAVAREYKRWRVYYKKKTQEAEEADRQRLRSLSISSGDETVSNQSPAMAQMMHIMDTHISTDVMLSSHPDTLFTSKSKHQLKEERQTPRDVMYQPTLDSLQPNLDEFVEHISSLADLIQQDETFTSSPRMASQRFSAEDINYQQQSHLEVMEHSTDYPTSCRQEYMDTSGSYNDYSVEYQDMEQPESLPEEPLPQLVEENSQEMYSPQPQESFEQLTSPVQSPLGSSLHGVPPNSVPQSPVQRSPSAMSPPSLGTSQYKASSVTTQHRQSFTTGSSMLSQQTDNVKITRNVSDSQLYNMESYGSPLKGVSLLPQYEPELPAQVQFPNLVAQLQSIQSKRPEVQASSSKVAKRARLPRNMSDSRLSSMGRVSRSSSLHNQSAVGTANMTPLEQIRAQAIAQGTMPPGPTYQVMPRFQTPVGHTKVPSYKRKSKMPRNMSDSSLLYMGLPQQHPQPSSSWIGQRVRKMSEPSLEVASSMAQQAFSQQLVAESLTPTSTQLVHSLASGVRESHSTLIDQLSQMSQASAQVPTSAGITSVPGVAGAGSLLGQLLLQNGNQSEAAAMTTTVDDNSQVMKQLLQLIQRQQHQQQQQQQQQQQSSQAMHSGELLALLKAVAQGDSCSDVASLLQASLQQGNQSQRQQLSLHNQQMQQQQIQQQQQLQQLLQHQQLQKQAPYAQQSSQLGTIQQTAQLQQQSTQSHQKQTQPQQLSPLQPFAPPTSQPLTQLLQQGAQSLPQLVAQISTMPVVQMSNLGIQTVAPVVRTTPIAIAPHPGTAVMAAPIHASSVLSTQYSLPIMTSATQGSKFAVTPLQQILRSTSPSLAAMTSQPSAAPGHQQFQVSNNEQSFTSSFSDPPGEHELSFGRSMKYQFKFQ